MSLSGGSIMRLLASFIAVFMLGVGPVLAQEAPDAARQHQLDLAERYLELTQGSDVTKAFRDYIEETYDASNLPADQRIWLTDQMTAMLEEVMALTLAEVQEDVADSFTTAELEAVVAFYETPMGRSIARKTVGLGVEMQEAMMPHLMTRVTTMGEKFCQQFDCSEMADAAAKSRR